jgi:hypothetical protein
MSAFIPAFKILLLYLAILFGIRLLLLRTGIFTSRDCPNCANPLKRYKRKRYTRLLGYLTFNVLSFRKVKCKYCDYKGVMLANCRPFENMNKKSAA